MIGRFSVDFVNLRSETYTNSSRVPTMRFGTPAEDAIRRDLTINALFYNIHSGLVEDFTGMGLQDLHNRIVRTPLPPLVTLTDDPLRCLRAIRFACRLGFNIDPQLAEAMLNPVVLDALEVKISKERVLGELDLMLKLLSAPRAVVLLHQYNLLPFILPMPKTVMHSADSTLLVVPLSCHNAASLAVVLLSERWSLRCPDPEVSSAVKKVQSAGEDRRIFMCSFNLMIVS